MPPRSSSKARKRTKARSRSRKRDPLMVDGKRPRPMFVDYKDVDMLKKLVNRHGRIVGRRKTGCSAASQTEIHPLGGRCCRWAMRTVCSKPKLERGRCAVLG